MIRVADREFKNQSSLIDFVRTIRDRYPDGATVAGTDAEFLSELVKRHPDFPDKFAPGIRRFYVDVERRGSRGFRFEAADGRVDDFSFLKCVSARPSSPDADAKVAARCAVEPQVVAFKARQFAGPVACALCGTALTRADSHVDHAPPATFLVLWSHFVQIRGSVPASAERPGFAGERVFVSDDACREWQEFHDRMAVLRMLCVRCNLGTARRGL